MLNKEEIEKLSKSDLNKYSSLSKSEKEIFAEMWRQKTETRGRHKKNCVCETCNKRREVKNVLINEAKTEAVEENTTTENLIVEEKTKPIEEKIVDASKQLEAELESFRNSQKQISENKTEAKPETETETKPETEIETEPEIEIEGDSKTKEITNFFSGALLLMFMDYVFPVILKFIVGFFNPKFKKIKSTSIEKLQLTEKEKTELEPSADAVVEYIFADANPIVLFAVAVGGIYAGKMMLLNENDFELPVKK